MRAFKFSLLGLLMGLGAYAARPGTEYNLLINLNGEEVRWTMPDAGASGMFGGASGIACVPVTPDAGFPAAANNVVEVMPLAPINLCERSTALVGGVVWDGGCGTSGSDPNFGLPLQAFVPKFIVLRSTTTLLCASSDAGVINAPVFSLQ